MNWFEGIEAGTKLKITLKDKEFIFIFESIKNGIVIGKLENGKLKRFKEMQIEEIEEVDEFTTQPNNTFPSYQNIISNINVSNNLIYRLENLSLTPLKFQGKEEFKEIKKENKDLYNELISLFNAYEYAKKINELDLKYDRCSQILYKLKNLLEKYQDTYEEIDKFLAFLLQTIDITYLDFFKEKPIDFYCFKNDIYYYFKRNNKKGFILTEDFFDEFFLDENCENEWLYGVKNISNFNSIKIFEYQYEIWNELNAKYKILLEESINYILNKSGINISGSLKEKITKLKEYFTTNSDYKEIKKEIDNLIKKIPIKKTNTITTQQSLYTTSNTNIEKYGNYRIAKLAKDKKDYIKAIKYFKLAYKNREKLESTIKDLAVTYYEVGDIESSKQFIFENEKKLSQSLSTYNFLENLYYSLGEYQKAIEYIDLLLNNSMTNTNRYTLLLGKKASCYIKLNKLSKAKEILKRILSITPGHPSAKKLLEQIESGGEIKDIDISYFGGGISKFIEETLNSYEEYAGIPPKIIEFKKFNIVTLKEIRKLIETAGKARPKERANYLLTEAKLMQELEPNNEENLRSVLARYCNAMALTHISENSQKEVIKFFYLEAFSLEDKWDSIVRQLYMFIEGLYKGYNIKINITLNQIIATELEKSILLALNNNFNIFLQNILDVFIVNNTIAKQLITIFFNNQKIYKIFKKKLNLTITTKNDFIEYWNNLIEKRKREYTNWLTKINSITKIDNIENLNLQINNILNDLKKDWLNRLDMHRLNQIIDIASNLNNFLKQRTFDDKERMKNYLITQINDLMTDIQSYPTKLSYEGYLPVLIHLEKLLQRSFNEILKSSTPEITLTALGECVVDKQNMRIKLDIKNSPNSSPVSNIIISVEENKDIFFAEKNREIFEILRGGNNINCSLDLTISDNVIKNRAIDITFKITYNIIATDEQVTKKFKLPLRLYTSDEFEKIENLYAPVAEGGAVKDESMFFGRREYIANIINALTNNNSKSIIIYGQKRSGKSTVLYHLEKSLEEKENAFCINFSMGEIIDDISESSVGFYYKILSAIEEKLEELEFEGIETIPFEKPSFEKLMQAPAIIFDEALKKFYKEFKNNEYWSNKKLIILIDEFTYIYTSIIKNQLSENFMKTWKAFIEKNIFSAVLVGQDITPKFKAKFPNEFGVTEDKRLTYLSKEDAKKLIENPIWNKKEDKSRYIGNAVEKIINYTACNPYYIQMFCSRVVDYMNSKKAINVTEGDVEEVFKSFIEGSESLTEDKFDNLLTAGDADINSLNVNDVKNALKQIARETVLTGSCFKEKIDFEDKELLNIILNDLVKREVVSQKDNAYKIKVELFEQWLLKH